MSFVLSKGPYCGDISALCLIPKGPYSSEHSLLLTGTGPQVVLYDLPTGQLLHSSCCFDGVRVHGICALSHVADASEPGNNHVATVAVHGEGRVKLFRLHVIQNSHEGKGLWQLRLLHTLPRFNHWVLDALFLQGSDSGLQKPDGGRDGDEGSFLAVGLTDNSLSLWDAKLCVLLYQIESTERCLLYSMRLWGKSLDTLRVASGTIFNEVLIWKLGEGAPNVNKVVAELNVRPVSGTTAIDNFAIFDKAVRPLHRLTGHEGSIHRISWAPNGLWIVSVSDDRTARVWKHCPTAEYLGPPPILGDSRIEMGPVIYGHGGRLWDCHAAEEFLVTASEDCTSRVWAPDGKHIATLKGHTGRGIWRCVYDINTSTVITAGADSAIRVESMSKWTSVPHSVTQSSRGNTEVMSILALPAGNLQSGGSINYVDSKSEYVRCISFAASTSLYVATNHGFLYRVDIMDNGKELWTTLTEGHVEGPIVCMDVLLGDADTVSQGLDGKPKEHHIVVGNGQGQARIMLVRFSGFQWDVVSHLSWSAGAERKLLGTFWCRALGSSYVFTTDPRGGIRVWSVKYGFPLGESENVVRSCVSPWAVCQSPFHNQIFCFDVCLQQEVIVVGDKRGNLVIASFPSPLCHVDRQESGAPLEVTVLALLKGAHGISRVTSISVVPALLSPLAEIVSTGKDGCICRFSFEKDIHGLQGKPQGVVCTGVERVSAITLVESVNQVGSGSKGEGRRIAAGFTAGDFLVWDLGNQCEVMRVSCGGWRRPFSYLSANITQQYFAFVKDSAIHVHRSWIPSPAETGGIDKFQPISEEGCSLGISQVPAKLLHMQFHGREIQSVQFIPSASKTLKVQAYSSWVATGAEDGSVRLTRFDPKQQHQLDMSQLLGEHTGGSAVRALTLVSDSHTVRKGPQVQERPLSGDGEFDINRTLLVAVGAKEVMTCWLLQCTSHPGDVISSGAEQKSTFVSQETQSDTSPAAAEGRETFEVVRTEPSYGSCEANTLIPKWISSYRAQKPRSAQQVAQVTGSIFPSRNVVEPEAEDGFGTVHQEDGTFDLSLQEGDPSQDDLRYMAVTAFSTLCSTTGLNLTFVVAASSDSTLTVLAFGITARAWLKVAVLDHHTAPVLSLTHLVIHSDHVLPDGSSERFLVFSGATDGCIAVWDITSAVKRTYVNCPQLELSHSESIPLRPLSGRGSQGGRLRKLQQYNAMRPKGGLQDKQDATDQVSENLHTKEGVRLGSKLVENIEGPLQMEGAETGLPNSHLTGLNFSQASSSFQYADKGSSNQGPDVASLRPIHILLAAHMSGVNCMSVGKLEVQKCSQLTSNEEVEYVLVSGGDDEGLHILTFSAELPCGSEGPGGPSQTEKLGEQAQITADQMLLKYRCTFSVKTQVSTASAHYSALKGIWTDGKFIFSTGLDQRLRCWRLSCTSEGSAIPSESGVLSVAECAHSVIDVPEPAALHVESAADGSFYRIAVVGRGLQILSFQRSSCDIQTEDPTVTRF